MYKFKEAFIKHGTDKFIWHGYDKYYQLIIYDEPINSVLEVGVNQGHSLYSWRELWPNAIIEGVDIKKSSNEKLKHQFKIYVGDSTTEINDIKNKSYDLIVDDGDHNWQSQYKTLIQLYDKANKFYVIEDILGIDGLNNLLTSLPVELQQQAEIYTSKLKYWLNKRVEIYIIFFDKTLGV